LELLKLRVSKNTDPQWDNDEKSGSNTIYMGINKNLGSLEKKEVWQR
jgi:hypothetical protein